MLAPNSKTPSPIAVLGAGDLVSHLRRVESPLGEPEYRFNVFREASCGEVTHSLRLADLSDLLSLCYVVAFAALDDGWLAEDERTGLQELIEKLDSIRNTESNYDG